MSFRVPECWRILKGPFGSDASFGNNGAFFVPRGAGKPPFKIIVSDEMNWDHVSVSLPDRCPTWDEMCKVKSIFWDEEDTVMQLHPPKSQWINNHPYCLHLWRPTDGTTIPLPPSMMVGYAHLNPESKP